MNLSKAASKALYWSSATSVSTALLQMLQLFALARFLTPGEFGLAAMMTVVLGAGSVFADVGMSNAILAHASLSRRVLSTLYWIGILSGILVAGAMIAAAPFASRFFDEPSLTGLLCWSSLTFLISPTGSQYQLLLQKDLRFRPIALIRIPANVIGTAITIISAWAGMGVMSYVVGNVTIAAISAVAFLIHGYRRSPLTLEFAPGEARHVFSFGAYQLAERTANYFTRNLDRILIGWLLGSTVLGFYNTASQLSQRPLNTISPIVGRITLPLYTKIQGSAARMTNAYLLTVELAAAVLFPLYAMGIVLAAPLVAVFLGDRWAAVAPILQWLCLLACLHTIGFPAGNLLLSLKRADVTFWLNILRLVPYLGAILIGSRFGPVGIAIGMLLAQLVVMVPTGFWVRAKYANISSKRFLKAILAPGIMAAAAAGAAQLAIALVAPQPPIVTIALGTVVVATVYCGCFLLFHRVFLLRVAGHFGVGKKPENGLAE